MTVLKLEGAAEDWHLHLSGDWSLAAMAQIEAQLNGLPDPLQGALDCDWSRAEAPGIGPVQALLMRLGAVGSQRLGSSGDRHLVGQFEATAQKAAAENRLSSIVDAFASAADASLAEIAAQAGEKLARVSEAR
ncbi:MAG TPA: hypothetical protein VII35_11550 [Steroidobacteraceae bacterium]